MVLLSTFTVAARHHPCVRSLLDTRLLELEKVSMASELLRAMEAAGGALTHIAENIGSPNVAVMNRHSDVFLDNVQVHLPPSLCSASR